MKHLGTIFTLATFPEAVSGKFEWRRCTEVVILSLLSWLRVWALETAISQLIEAAAKFRIVDDNQNSEVCLQFTQVCINFVVCCQQ